MFSGFGLVVLLILCVAMIIGLVNYVRLHPFFAIIAAAYTFALFGGVELKDLDTVIRTGFGSLLTYIGIVITLGTIIGVILEKSGAAVSMANFIISKIGRKHPEIALGLVGWVVSIPVFCDSGFVILSPLKKSIAKAAKSSMITMTVVLSVGLYASHTLIPPTPGPIAAAANLGIDNTLGMVIIMGVIVSLFALAAGYFWAKFIGSKIDDSVLELEVDEKLIEENYGQIPSFMTAFLPIFIPILLIALGTIANLPSKPFGTGTFAEIILFTGKPTTSLFIGVLVCIPLIKNIKDQNFNQITAAGLKVAAPILLITAAGGSFGAAIKATPIVNYIGDNLQTLSLGLMVPFLIAAALKTAQGSSTTSLVVTSGIVASLLPGLGLDSEMGRVLTVMAIGAGAMTVSHSNDSYFWVVAETSGFDTATAYKTHTVASLCMGLASIAATMILGMFLL
jgi:GntP family gluconate:H+ symporter